MGNLPSFGSIAVRTEKPFYLPGETVNGIIYLSLIAPYPAKEIYLKIKGEETTQFVDVVPISVPDPSDPQHIRVLYEHDCTAKVGKHKIMRNKIPVFKSPYGSQFPQGQWQIPFSFLLPQKMPGTFFHEEKGKRDHEMIDPTTKKMKNGYKKHYGTDVDVHFDDFGYVAKVRYVLKAVLEPDAISKGIVETIKYKEDILIREVSNKPMCAQGREVDQDMFVCWCSAKGHCLLKVFFEKDAFFPGEEATAHCEVDNTGCQLDVTNVRFTFMQYLTIFSSHDMNVRAKSDIWTLFEQTYDGIPATQKVTRTMKCHMIDKSKNSAELKPTCTGTLVQNRFALEVHVNMDACICHDPPSADIPVAIIPRELIWRNLQSMAPPNWQPQIIPPITITFSDQYNY